MTIRRFSALPLAALTLLAAPAFAHDDDWVDAMGTGAQTAAKAPAANTAPTIAEADMPLDPRFSPERIHADVGFFADDLLLGRDTGSVGHEIATRYVAARFLGLGLTPMGDQSASGRSYLQRITFQKTSAAKAPRAWTSPAPTARQSALRRARTHWSAFR
jgi:hypothetical protein